MSSRRVPRNITFHSGASEDFRNTILDAYEAVSEPIRRRLESFAGAVTLIRTLDRPFDIGYGVANKWNGLSSAPSTSRYYAPLGDRSITRWGRPSILLSEHDASGRSTPMFQVSPALHHEIGHRIDEAISGDNYVNGELTRRGPWFSQSAQFMAAVRQDLRDAGWPPAPGQPAPPEFRVWDYLLPRRSASGQISDAEWRRASREIFAELYVRRFTTSLNDETGILGMFGRWTTDFGIFRRAGLLVDGAVATFTGEPVMPINPNAGDYRPGEQPAPLAGPGLLDRGLSLITGARLFNPVGPEAPHGAAPGLPSLPLSGPRY